MMTDTASERLLESVSDGLTDYVLTAVDGRASIRLRLSIDSVQSLAQRVGKGKVVVDWSRAVISNGDSRVSLSRTELRLLSALVEGNGEPVSRASLIAHAWPAEDRVAVRENALGVYVFLLRKRLAAIGLGNALQTVRGIGYRITA